MLAAIAKPELFSKLVLLGPNSCFVNEAAVGYVGGFEREDLEGLLSLMEQNYIGWANYLAPVVAAEDASGAVTQELSASFCSTDPVAARVFAQATFFLTIGRTCKTSGHRVSCCSTVTTHLHPWLWGNMFMPTYRRAP